MKVREPDDPASASRLSRSFVTVIFDTSAPSPYPGTRLADGHSFPLQRSQFHAHGSHIQPIIYPILPLKLQGAYHSSHSIIHYLGFLGNSTPAGAGSSRDREPSGAVARSALVNHIDIQLMRMFRPWFGDVGRRLRPPSWIRPVRESKNAKATSPRRGSNSQPSDRPRSLRV